jgi:hypothetical protein
MQWQRRPLIGSDELCFGRSHYQYTGAGQHSQSSVIDEFDNSAGDVTCRDQREYLLWENILPSKIRDSCFAVLAVLVTIPQRRHAG